MSASDGHTVNPDPDQQAYDVCLHCGQAIHMDVYGSGLVTMIGRNAECYAR